MKRIEPLQPLSKEHHLSLVLAQKAIKVSDSNDQDAIAGMCRDIVAEYPDSWRVHFQIEEDSIFWLFTDSFDGDANISRQHWQEAAQLCQQLQQEHERMNAYYEQMKAGDYSVLNDFGALLKQHTRTEERELFPLLEELLTEDELNTIQRTSINYRQA